MSEETILSIAVQCDRAARDGANEDNCLVVSEVGVANPSVNHFGDVTVRDFSKMIPLRGKGCLLVVADGMGGMNAGEVASQIAVTTLQDQFSEEGMKHLDMSSDAAIKKFIRKAIVAADIAIKKEAARDSEKEGMGTTVALLWLLENNTAYYAWCGDSRIYSYSPDHFLKMLSRDHSYVMEVLQLSEEEAFEHPNNNIITRSLGNPSEKANPDVEGPINIYKDDIFLLCSDGLCGVLRTDEIQNVIETIPDANHLPEAIEQLWTDAAAAHWHDNVTTLLCQVASGPERPVKQSNPLSITQKNNVAAVSSEKSDPSRRQNNRLKDTLIALLAVVVVFVGGYACFRYFDSPKKVENGDTVSQTPGNTHMDTQAEPSNSTSDNEDVSPTEVEYQHQNKTVTTVPSAASKPVTRDMDSQSGNAGRADASSAAGTTANGDVPSLRSGKSTNAPGTPSNTGGNDLLRTGGKNLDNNELQTNNSSDVKNQNQ